MANVNARKEMIRSDKKIFVPLETTFTEFQPSSQCLHRLVLKVKAQLSPANSI